MAAAEDHDGPKPGVLHVRADFAHEVPVGDTHLLDLKLAHHVGELKVADPAFVLFDAHVVNVNAALDLRRPVMYVPEGVVEGLKMRALDINAVVVVVGHAFAGRACHT